MLQIAPNISPLHAPNRSKYLSLTCTESPAPNTSPLHAPNRPLSFLLSPNSFFTYSNSLFYLLWSARPETLCILAPNRQLRIPLRTCSESSDPISLLHLLRVARSKSLFRPRSKTSFVLAPNPLFTCFESLQIPCLLASNRCEFLFYLITDHSESLILLPAPNLSFLLPPTALNLAVQLPIAMVRDLEDTWNIDKKYNVAISGPLTRPFSHFPHPFYHRLTSFVALWLAPRNWKRLKLDTPTTKFPNCHILTVKNTNCHFDACHALDAYHVLSCSRHRQPRIARK